MTHTEIIITILVAILGSSALNTIISRIFVKRDKASASSKAIMYCLLVNLQNEARRIIERGYITRLEYNQFKDMYDIYKACGGDGYADELMNQIEVIFKNTLQGGQII